MIVTVQILKNSASPELKNWLAGLQDRKPLHLVLGRRLMNDIKSKSKRRSKNHEVGPSWIDLSSHGGAQKGFFAKWFDSDGDGGGD